MESPPVLQGIELRMIGAYSPGEPFCSDAVEHHRIRWAAFWRVVPSSFSLNLQWWGFHLVSGASHRCCTRGITQQRHVYAMYRSPSHLSLSQVLAMSRALCTPRVPYPFGLEHGACAVNTSAFLFVGNHSSAEVPL